MHRHHESCHPVQGPHQDPTCSREPCVQLNTHSCLSDTCAPPYGAQEADSSPGGLLVTMIGRQPPAAIEALIVPGTDSQLRSNASPGAEARHRGN